MIAMVIDLPRHLCLLLQFRYDIEIWIDFFTWTNRYICISEQQLQPELNVARVARGGDPAEGRGAEEVVREIEVWVVEEVEGLGAEL